VVGGVVGAYAGEAAAKEAAGAVYILFANERTAAMAERTVSELVGASVLEYVDEEAAWAYAAAMSFGTDRNYADTYSGPIRIRVISATGRAVPADLWTANRTDDPAVGGVVCLLSAQTASLGIADALAAVAADASWGEISERIADALSGFPVVADAAVLSMDEGTWMVSAQRGVPAGLVDGTAGHQLWATALETGERVLHATLDTVPRPLRDLAEQMGYRTVWAVPVQWRTDPIGAVVVLFRRFVGEPTPNELTHVHQAASVLALSEHLSRRR